jgi:hypothetical protein
VEASAAPRPLGRGSPHDFRQAEAALDTEMEAPARADVRAGRTIRMLGEESFQDSIERGKQARTMEQRGSLLNAHILPTIGDVPVTKWRIEHSRKVMEPARLVESPYTDHAPTGPDYFFPRHRRRGHRRHPPLHQADRCAKRSGLTNVDR